MMGNIKWRVRQFFWKYFLFDRSYYLTIHSDVRAKNWWSSWRYSSVHYILHGIAEKRASRHTPLGLQTVRGMAAGFRAERDFLSGVCINFRDIDFDRKPKAYVISLAWRSIKIVTKYNIEQSCVIDNNKIHLKWKTDPTSKGKLYYILIVEKRRISRIAIDFVREPYIYSPAVSEYSVPRSICISPVTQCNLNCIHCISRFSRGSVNELSDEHWHEIRSLVKDGEIKAISSDYSGDILFASRRRNPWIDRFIDAGCSLRLTTHGNDLTEEVADRLLKSKLHTINFSLDTMDPSDYQAIRKGGGDHEEVLSKIRMFMRKRNSLRPNLKVILSFVIMKRNIETLFKAIDLAKEIGATFIQGNHLIIMTEDMTEESLALVPVYYNDIARRLHEKARAADVAIMLPEPFRGVVARSGNAPCQFVVGGAFILGNGDIMACCMPGSKMGSLREGTLKEIWNGEKYQSFRMAVNSANPPRICRACPIHRYQNNYRSYAWGLDEKRQIEFEARCLEASRQLRGTEVWNGSDLSEVQDTSADFDASLS